MTMTQHRDKHRFLEFFAGAGLVAEGLKDFFHPVWANDICAKKASVYLANHKPADHFVRRPLQEIDGGTLPFAELSWASFPCQDLSLAGRMTGIDAERSGLVWRWLEVMDDMHAAPPVLAIENVTGMIMAHKGAGYRKVHNALVRRGYKAGPLVINACHWTPQSRPRVFVVAVKKEIDIARFTDGTPGWTHTPSLVRAVRGLPGMVWWKTPPPPDRHIGLMDIIDFDAPCDDPVKTEKNLGLIPPGHRDRLSHERMHGLKAAPGYKRTRNGRQVLELRFDGLAGCLRTPNGGSSRQFLVLARNGGFSTRLLTVREAAALMGAPHYRLPGSYNDAYRAMGDAVAVPVVRYLAENLLKPLIDGLS